VKSHTTVDAALRLRRYREDLRFSQADLARRSGVSRFKLNQFEVGSGELTSDELERIQSALQAELERLRQMTLVGVSAEASQAGSAAA
jgi:transcriptional regulator with XRE-family HTH domain